MKQQGFFITLEGIDGTGKSTHAALLVKYLRQQGFQVTRTREPGGTPAGEAIRAILMARRGKSISPLAELALMYAARAQHIEEVVRPALESGNIVVSDRYNDASFAYQGFGRGLGVDTVKAFDKLVCGNVQPNLTLLLDLDPKAAHGRTQARRAGKSRFEAAGRRFQSKVRDGYLTIARRNPKRLIIIKCDRPAPEVQEEIRNVVDHWIVKRRYSLPKRNPVRKIRG